MPSKHLKPQPAIHIETFELASVVRRLSHAQGVIDGVLNLLNEVAVRSAKEHEKALEVIKRLPDEPNTN